jgi:hypothetical protein
VITLTHGENAEIYIIDGKGARSVQVWHPIHLNLGKFKIYSTSRYFQPLGISPESGDGLDQARTRQSSSDPALTAFAQLGAHRLKAKRGLITLSTKDTEYIAAESGVGLGLQQDDDSKDPLWHGTGYVSSLSLWYYLLIPNCCY